jgi:hypothetical protein
MLTLQQLLDLEEIKKLKYRYIRAADTHQLDLLEACFTEDSHIWLANGRCARTGIAAIMDFYRDLLTTAPSFISTRYVRIFEQMLSAGGLPGFRTMVDPDLGVKSGW